MIYESKEEQIEPHSEYLIKLEAEKGETYARAADLLTHTIVLDRIAYNMAGYMIKNAQQLYTASNTVSKIHIVRIVKAIIPEIVTNKEESYKLWNHAMNMAKIIYEYDGSSKEVDNNNINQATLDVLQQFQPKGTAN